MNNTNNESSLVLATLTDEAAESSLFGLESSAIIALISLAGGEKVFAEANQGVVEEGCLVDVGDDDSMLSAFNSHRSEILRFNEEMAKVCGFNSAALLIANRETGYSAYDIGEAWAVLQNDGDDSTHLTAVVKREAVNVVLEGLHSTYNSMSEV